MTKEFNLSSKIGHYIDYDNQRMVYPAVQTKDVKEFIKRREARLRNQIRIHWGWLKNKSSKDVADFIVTIANKEVGEELSR